MHTPKENIRQVRFLTPHDGHRINLTPRIRKEEEEEENALAPCKNRIPALDGLQSFDYNFALVSFHPLRCSVS